MKTNMEIKRTKYYDMFKFKKENREINYNKVLSLKNKLIENGRQIVPIICNSEFEVIDGQHRLEALKELGWEVMYYVDDAVTTKDLISINNTQKNWGMLDYIHFYASSGDETYKGLEKLTRKYDDIPLKAILAAIGAKYIKDRRVKEGDIIFSKEEFAEGEKCLEFLHSLKKDIKIRINNQAIFFFLVVKAYYLEGIDRERLYKSIVEKYGTENYGTAIQCSMVLEHWYNHKLRTYRYISNELLPKR